MQHTHTIETTSTVMRGKVCVLQLDVIVEVECEDGTDYSIDAFYIGDVMGEGPIVHKLNDPQLFAVLLSGIDKRDLTERVQALYKWEQDRETGFQICKGLAA